MSTKITTSKTATIVKALFFIFIFGFLLVQFAFAQDVFDPPKQAYTIKAVELNESQKIRLDGVLDEAFWQNEPLVSQMVMKDPNQLEPATYNTSIWVAFDASYLYIAANMIDPEVAEKGFRVTELNRDFSFMNNDLFGVSIDGLLDKRNASVFQVNAMGAMRDMQSYDDTNFNNDWNALWFTRTSKNEDGWSVEIAIPWNTIRYKEGNDRVGILFTRTIRRLNEVDMWPAVPRAFNAYRMNYAAELIGLDLPKSTANVQINPYVLYAQNHQRNDFTRADLEKENDYDAELGGEVKWALNANTVLDLTVNTDFAQADVDRQIVNLSRFNVRLPERRQFFLENSDLLNVSGTSFIAPFFSRKIGLDDFGSAIPIQAGARLVRRGNDFNAAAMLIRQGDGSTDATNFSVLRYSKNFGSQSRLGYMFTFKHSENPDGADGFNMTHSIDGFTRINRHITFNGMLSLSDTPESITKEITNRYGSAVRLSVVSNTNLLESGLRLNYVNKNYNPEIGFLGLENFININPFMQFDIRSAKLPDWIRRYQPYLEMEMMLDGNTAENDQTYINGSVFRFEMENGGSFGWDFRNEWQSIRSDIMIGRGQVAADEYSFMQQSFFVETDRSAVVSAAAEYKMGDFYDGTIKSYEANLQYLPSPHLSVESSISTNTVRNLGLENSDFTTRLYSFEGRYSINPRITFTGFYQHNQDRDIDTINLRLSWEYRPLSFIYLVFNQNRGEYFDYERNRRLADLNQGVIAKLTFLYQF